MDDLISRQATIYAIVDMTIHDRDGIRKRAQEDPTDWIGGIEDALSVVEELPSAERKGKWINHRNDSGHNIADCSECGSTIQWFDDDENPRFCCMCGSRLN